MTGIATPGMRGAPIGGIRTPLAVAFVALGIAPAAA